LPDGMLLFVGAAAKGFIGIRSTYVDFWSPARQTLEHLAIEVLTFIRSCIYLQKSSVSVPSVQDARGEREKERETGQPNTACCILF
jgi:hypothetical protein